MARANQAHFNIFILADFFPHYVVGAAFVFYKEFSEIFADDAKNDQLNTANKQNTCGC